MLEKGMGVTEDEDLGRDNKSEMDYIPDAQDENEDDHFILKDVKKKKRKINKEFLNEMVTTEQPEVRPEKRKIRKKVFEDMITTKEIDITPKKRKIDRKVFDLIVSAKKFDLASRLNNLVYAKANLAADNPTAPLLSYRWPFLPNTLFIDHNNRIIEHNLREKCAARFNHLKESKLREERPDYFILKEHVKIDQYLNHKHISDPHNLRGFVLKNRAYRLLNPREAKGCRCKIFRPKLMLPNAATEIMRKVLFTLICII
ncbi:hypothetical protein AKO1_002301, partial [Acrasis kona]